MLWKVGLKEQRETKNKCKVTQELVERKVKKKNIYKKYKQEKKRATYKKKGKIAKWENIRKLRNRAE